MACKTEREGCVGRCTITIRGTTTVLLPLDGPSAALPGRAVKELLRKADIKGSSSS